MLTRFLNALRQWLPSRRATPREASRWDAVTIRLFNGDGMPPPRHWKACHPRTVRRFKAHLTCAKGHALVLSEHAISVDGAVWPSVVCKAPRCSFHEFVRLEGWSGGSLR